MHLASLERFDFDSVLLPCNPSMLASAEYAAEFDALCALCRERDVPVQTIKAIARRRWPEGAEPTRTTWYEPLESAEAIERAIHFVLGHEGLFVNTASDLDLLPLAIRAAERFTSPPPPDALASDQADFGIEPLFVRGYQPGA
jgi:hypothetical protein